VNVRKAPRTQEREGLVEGNIYEVMIEDVGRKGDGVARMDRYIIYVPGTAKGTRTKIKINKVTGNVAFATVSTEQPSR
jgi:translation initiation factor 2 subunit 2